MVMAEYFPHDRLQELWHQIHHLHLTFLDTEDSPQKIEQRNKLEVCIREYLCIAPHNRKFYCSETAEVLHRSAVNKKLFSGYRAAVAFNALSMYAGNLLSQPWRKEYRQIKTYSGFYKHQIDGNLIGAEAIFEAMGYKQIGDGLLVLEGPVCPDRVTNVSQDSIVAFVECQILKSIWEEVSTSFKVSWLDVLEFRESHICSPEQCVRILKFRHHERHYQQSSFPTTSNDATMYHHRYNYPPNCYSTCTGNCLYNPYYPTYGYVAQPYLAPIRYPAFHHHTIPLPGPPPQIKPCNGYCNCPPIPSNGYVCPTGQLIELDNDSSNNRRLQDVESHKQLAKSTNLDSLTLSKSKEDGTGTFESWDYVYRNLESQGYYKDLGERPDILSQQTDKKKAKKNKSSVELEDELAVLTVKEETPKLGQSSSFDNISSHAQTKLLNGLAKNKFKCKSWSCSTCTYLNKSSVEICAMCGKSKNKVEQQMLAVGGPECPRCTLVNQKDANKCQACDASLLKSPTYV